MTKLWESVGHPAQNVSFVRIENWEAIVYETQAPNANNSEIQAHSVQAGTWIHLHISMMSSVESRAKLVAFLQTILVREKADSFSRSTLVSLLNTPEYRWVFTHICVPLRFLGASGYSNKDFVDAYFSVMQVHWDASLEARRRGDQAGASKALGPILHSVIDLYWPNRVERDASGAITRFRDCEDLGNLQGVLHQEKTGPGLTGEAEERAGYYLGQVFRMQMDARPLEEVAEMLRTGPMKLSEAHAAMPLGQK